MAVRKVSFITAIQFEPKLKQPGGPRVEIDGNLVLGEVRWQLHRVLTVENAM